MDDSNHNVMGMDIMTVVAMIFIMVAIISTQNALQQVLTNFESIKTAKNSDPGTQNPSETVVVYFVLSDTSNTPIIRLKNADDKEQTVSYQELITRLKRTSPSALTIYTDKRYPAEHFGQLLLDASQMNIRIQLGAVNE